MILFGTRPALGRHLAQAELVFEYRSTEAAGPAADREEYREGFFAWYDALWTKINLRNDKQSYQDGLFRLDIPTFDEGPVREALLNAVAHRDYRLAGSVFVRQYAHRLEVVSLGGLPAGITPDNILDQQNPRNRRLAEVLEKCGLIERAGQGMNLMVESAIRQGKAPPSLAGTAAHEVRLTLEGRLRHPAFVRFLERLSAETVNSFTTQDFMALDYLHREQPLTAALKDRLPGLVTAGAVEAIGRGKGTRYLLSRSLHAAMGAKGVHTRKRGLDYETKKALLVQHLRAQDGEGAPMADLRQVFPTDHDRGILRMLHDLRDNAVVEKRGDKRGSRWHLVTDNRQPAPPMSDKRQSL